MIFSFKALDYYRPEDGGPALRTLKYVKRTNECSLFFCANAPLSDPGMMDRFMMVTSCYKYRDDGKEAAAVGNDLSIGSGAWSKAAGTQARRAALIAYINMCINMKILPEINLIPAAAWWETFMTCMQKVYPSTRRFKRQAPRFLHQVRTLCVRHAVRVLWEDPDMAITSGKFDYRDVLKAIPWLVPTEEMCIIAAAACLWDVVSMTEVMVGVAGGARPITIHSKKNER